MRAYDEADPLCHLRHRFALAQDVIYLDGSTFGHPPKAPDCAGTNRTASRSCMPGAEGGGAGERTMRHRAARLVGARPHEIFLTRSVNADFFTLVVAAARMQRGWEQRRRLILAEERCIPATFDSAAHAAELLGLRAAFAPRGDLEPPDPRPYGCMGDERAVPCLDCDAAMGSAPAARPSMGRRTLDRSGIVRPAAATGSGHMMTLAAFILSLAGFASLACAMSKHHQDLFGAMPGRWPVIALRGVGWLCLTGSLASAIAAAGPSVGIVLSFGIATLAALTVALLLTYRGTWWRL